MKVMTCQLLIILLVHAVQAQNCSDQCCYWYHTTPGSNSECHPAEGSIVLLVCKVYVPHGLNNTPLATVKWYKSVDLNSCKTPIKNSSFTPSTEAADLSSLVGGLYRDIYVLPIHNINSIDSAFYWCQLEVNETYLSQSPYVNLTVNSSNTNQDQSGECSPFDYGGDPGICAISSIMCGHNESNCVTSRTPIPTSTSMPTSMNEATTSATSTCTMNAMSTSMKATTISITPSTSDWLIPVATASPSGGLLILMLFICCIGLCLCRRKRKRKTKDLSIDSDMESRLDIGNALETPIDLATGQLNRQVTEVTATSAEHTHTTQLAIGKDTDTAVQSYNDQKAVVLKTYATKDTPSSQDTLTRSKAMKPLQEKQADNGSQAEQSNKPHQNVVEDEKLLGEDFHGLVIPPERPVSPKPQKKLHQYEDIETETIPEPPKEEEEGPMYDDLLTNLEVSAKFQQSASSNTAEHKYHVLCTPTEMKTFDFESAVQPDILSSHTYETVLGRNTKTEGGDGLIFPEADKQASTPQRRPHQYETVDNKRSGNTEPVHTSNRPLDHYSVLANPMDTNVLQEGVVQEESTDSPVEDKYYSIAKVHRLVPVGKSIGTRVDDHLYQALDDSKLMNTHSARDRHNTFSASTSMIAAKHSTENLVRTYSIGGSVERLDPMYDEPYKPVTDQTRVVKDIYNLDDLFDDPKYAKKPAEKRCFDDPQYSTCPSDKPQDVSAAVPAPAHTFKQGRDPSKPQGIYSGAPRHGSFPAHTLEKEKDPPTVPPRMPYQDTEDTPPVVRLGRERKTN